MSAFNYSRPQAERRAARERRGQLLIDETVEARRDRRANERRDSPRSAGRFWVKDPTHGGIAEVFDGDVSFCGASFVAMHPPHGEALEVGMWLPGQTAELRCKARVLKRKQLAGATSVHLRFEEMDPPFARALALYLEASCD